ncbi:hypothetical protein [Pyxidicoccus caerfyrddinensis]|uniref:hypothetical protein n=1 Tax=Pyxidicoccus caerfyrddinensis TaxID=2709663 RepID=UPI0013DA9659|nr:hypothetical protein [Pyxidicoccus caerfyrddinensis]
MGKRTKRDKPLPEYTAEHIEKLTPAEAVRRRPEMYLGPERRCSLLVAHAVLDPFFATGAQCSRVEVSWTSDGVIQVVDDDGSMDTGARPHGGPHIEHLLSYLMAGVGLSQRGSGLCLVNLMSEWFAIEVHQPTRLYRQRFDAGEPRSPETGAATPPWHTLVTFKPDGRCIDARVPLTANAIIHDLQPVLANPQSWFLRTTEHPALSFESSPTKLVLRRVPSAGSPPADNS